MKRSRRNHSPAFKAKVALQAIRGDKTLSELAQQHQVHATQITAWKQQLLEHAAELFANGQSLAEDSQQRVQVQFVQTTHEGEIARADLSGSVVRRGARQPQ